jgi:hypothetical protein
MTASLPWPQEKVDTLVRLIEQKISYPEIARQMGISKSSVVSKIKRLKLTNLKKNESWTEEKLKQAIDLLKEGLSNREIAERMSITLNSVYGKLSDLQIYREIRSKKTDKPAPIVVENTCQVPREAPPRMTSFDQDQPIPPPRMCQWPSWGDKERPNHQYCGGKIFAGSYCDTHADIAYSKTVRQLHSADKK